MGITLIDGITVSYSNDGVAAYIDREDGTLTVEVNGSGGALSIVVGPSAFFYWGGYVDIYLMADAATLKSIKIKGSDTCTPFVCGQVNYVGTFSLQNGVVGDTDFYGLDFGLGMVSPLQPTKIAIKNGYATAQMFGFAYKLADDRAEIVETAPITLSRGKSGSSEHVETGKVAMIRRVQRK